MGEAGGEGGDVLDGSLGGGGVDAENRGDSGGGFAARKGGFAEVFAGEGDGGDECGGCFLTFD